MGIIIFLPSCSEYGKLLKSKDLGLKQRKAMEYYKAEKYIKAYPLFEELLTIYKGTRKAEKLYYYFSYCEYHMGDFVMAGHHFKEFTRRFPKSKYVEECLFMNAICYYKNSPIPSLDQTNTYSAINELQLFANLFPMSSRLDSCNILIDKLRHKLEQKAFDNAYQHYHMRDYKSAIIEFQNMLQDYPDTKYREKCMFLILKSNYQLANKSIDKLKLKRLQDATKAANEFITHYKTSPFLDQVKDLQLRIMRQRETLAYTLSKSYYNRNDYKMTVKNCEEALRTYPGHNNRKEIIHMLIASKYKLAMNGNIRLREERLKETLHSIEQYRKEMEGSRYKRLLQTLEKSTKAEIRKLPLSVPQWYAENGNYRQAIQLYNALSEQHSPDIGKGKLHYLLIKTYFSQAQESSLRERRDKYMMFLCKYDSLKPALEGSGYEKTAASMFKKASAKAASLPYEIPMSYYRNGKYRNALNEFRLTLQQQPDFGKKKKFQRLVVKAGLLSAVKSQNTALKKQRIAEAIKTCNEQNEPTTGRLAHLCRRCLRYADRIEMEPLISEYRKVLYEKRNFAAHIAKTLELYEKTKPELMLDKSVKRAVRIYNSVLKLKTQKDR